MKAILIALFPLLLASLSMGQDAEIAPKVINYQGKLVGPDGVNPLGGAAGGTFRLRFELFAQASDGAAVWAEERDVVVIGGIFNVVLGGAGGDPVGTISRDLGTAFEGPDRFLQTTIVSGPGITGEQKLEPRQQLASTPYALVSQTTDRAAVAALAESLIPELTKALNPPGTIIAYAGEVADGGVLVEPVPGYLLCNGAVIDATAEDGKYAALRAVLKNAWGHGGNAGNDNVANLPDLRGVFLRGWSGDVTDGYADPDRNKPIGQSGARIARLAGGNIGNLVGSFQMDEFKNHNHNNGSYNRLMTSDGLGTTRGGSYVDNTPGEPNLFGAAYIQAVGGSETRGKNANVVYLIKY